MCFFFVVGIDLYLQNVAKVAPNKITRVELAYRPMLLMHSTFLQQKLQCILSQQPRACLAFLFVQVVQGGVSFVKNNFLLAHAARLFDNQLWEFLHSISVK